MSNFNLNPGGIICGLLGGVGAGVYLYSNTDDAQRIGKLVVACIVGGAVAGNFIWGLIFRSRGTDE